MLRAQFCFILLSLSDALLEAGLGSDDELRLINYLFNVQGYNPLIRPVRNTSEKIMVELGVAMVQLISIDEKNQIMKSNVWLRVVWQDYQFQWDPAEYGGITIVRIAPEKVWTPDIVLFNNADGKYEVTYKSRILVHHTGRIQFIPPSIYKSSCQIDVEFFPFDEQKCTLNFGSWTFDGDQVGLTYYEGKRHMDLNDYLISGTWDIIACPGKVDTWRQRATVSTKERNMTQMQYIVSIRRKTLFYTVNLIIPCVLISFLTVCVFYLPAEANEKITLSISILLALTVFMLLVQKILPPNSTKIPLIAYYLSFTFILNISSIVASVIIVNWSNRTPKTHRMNAWARIIFLGYLPKLLFMERPHQESTWRTQRWLENIGFENSIALGDDLLLGVDELFSETENKCNMSNNIATTNHVKSYGSTVQRQPSSAAPNYDQLATKARHSAYTTKGPSTWQWNESNSQPRPLAQKACKAVQYIANHMRNENEYAKMLEDWKYIGLVIDRLLLIAFMIVTTGGTLGILFNNPNIFEVVDQREIIKKIQGQALLDAAQQLSGGGVRDLL